MPLDDDDVREILRLIDESELDELRVESEGFSLHVVRGLATAAGPGPDPAAPTVDADGVVTIESPMLGTFYRAEGPGAEPFVQPGSRLEPDTIVCIIEVKP